MKTLKFMKISLLTLLIVVLASCGGADARKEKYLAKGKEYLEQNNLDKARLEFRNVLQIDPKFAEGHYYMALMNERLQSFQKSLAGYNKALELKPNYVDALAGTARIYLIANMPSKVIEQAEKALAIDPENIEVLAVQAGALYRMGDKEGAVKTLLHNISVDSDHAATLGLLSKIYMVENKPEKAEAILTASLQRNPENFSVKMLLVQLYNDSKQYEKAAKIISDVVQSKPEVLDYRLRLAYFYNLLKQYKKAEDTLRKAVVDLPEDFSAKRNLIQYLAEKTDIQTAHAQLDKFIQEDDSNPDLKIISAMLYRNAKDNTKAETIYRNIIQKYSGEAVSVSAQYNLAQLLLEGKRIDEAKTVLAELLKDSPTHNDALTMHGILALSEKDASSAIADFRAVLKDQPQSVRHIKLLAEAYLSEKQFDLALEQLKTVLHLQPQDTQSRLVLAKILHQDKRFKDVIEQLNVLLKIEPDNIEAEGLILKAYLATQDYEPALILVQQMQANELTRGMGYFYHGLVLQAQNKLGASMLKYAKALEIKPDSIEPLGAYVRAALGNNQPSKAIAKLKSLLKKNPDHVIAQNLLGEVLLQQKKYSAAAKEFSKTITVSPQWWIPYRNLASTQQLLKQPEKAIQTYRQGLQKAQQKNSLIPLLANLLVQQNKAGEAIKLYEGVLVEQPDSAVVANNLAITLVEYSQDKASKDRAMALVEKFQTSDNASFQDTLGWVHYKRGELDKAISALLEADRLSPQQPLIYYHLGKAYFDKGDKLSAQKYLTKVASSSAEFKGKQDAKRLLSSMDKA